MFCPKCGTQVPETDHYCPICGEPLGVKTKAPDESDHTAIFEPEDIERTKILSAICYLNFIFIIIALLLEPNSRFLRYHINQSIVLYVFGIICGIAAVVPFLGWIVTAVGGIASFVFLIMGVIRAFKGRAKDLPLIGKYTVVHYE